jgi:hypothetical protein
MTENMITINKHCAGGLPPPPGWQHLPTEEDQFRTLNWSIPKTGTRGPEAASSSCLRLGGLVTRGWQGAQWNVLRSEGKALIASIYIYVNNISRTDWLGVCGSAGTYLKCAHLSPAKSLRFQTHHHPYNNIYTYQYNNNIYDSRVPMIQN